MLTDRKALVTGAAGGIGAAVTRQLRAAGVRVAVADRDPTGIAAKAHLPGDLLDPAYADSRPLLRRRRWAGWISWSTMPASSPVARSRIPLTMTGRCRWG